MIWQAELPARQYHNLSEQAAEQLLELLPGTQVCFGRPAEVAPRADGAPRGMHDVIGSVMDASRLPNRRIRVRIRFHENDHAAKAAHEMLEAGQCIVGMDATAVIDRGKPEEWPDAPPELQKRLVHVHKITGLRSLEVVPESSDPRYTPPLPPPFELDEDGDGDGD